MGCVFSSRARGGRFNRWVISARCRSLPAFLSLKTATACLSARLRRDDAHPAASQRGANWYGACNSLVRTSAGMPLARAPGAPGGYFGMNVQPNENQGKSGSFPCCLRHLAKRLPKKSGGSHDDYCFVMVR
ncbi:transporter [Pseudomonas aeruginosa]|nr:transporter [Pseudomonas aeruginosa]EWH28827.1 transporter [Pseudomonas aeruginosa SG17M]MDE5496747.1 transporter [Pseudomonas sp. 4B]AYN83136.1 transporter [Pseudomonas aeruginosa]AYW39993.1 transporter [Pseudomonas aeruginosa]